MPLPVVFPGARSARTAIGRPGNLPLLRSLPILSRSLGAPAHAGGGRGHNVPGESVSELAFRDGVMDRIRLRERRFHEQAYLFVLSALEFAQHRLPERRHISGAELAGACRDLALERFGVLARVVLEHWGVRCTADLGDIVFTLVDLGLLISLPSDTRDEFVGVFEFEEAFERDYPWNRAHRV
jgi:uncharacterized repeat protein (TIGR04138 family)